ncbi:spermatogenesis-associated protein 48 [Antechinus flavipes]|uniref:spermatogenesis-associated protein 48 n=1 Tax=Antechinus flavipes TaxID=38775 RepID=UPI002235DCB2|nr:spermatogenesis-associated protein 48 [Antechinus flavipes]
MTSDHKQGQITIPEPPIKAVKVPLRKMDYTHYCHLLKKMEMPFVRGREDRHIFSSFEEKDSRAFLKFHPYPSPGQPDYHLYCPYPPPPGKDFALFPHRKEMSLGDPCSGFISAGGDANLLPGVGKSIPNLANYIDVKPQQQIPLTEKGLKKEIKKRTTLLEEINENTRWNSTKTSDAVMRARLGGWTSSKKVIPDLTKIKGGFGTARFSFVDSKPKHEEGRVPIKSEEQRVKESFYKTSTQKAFELVPLDRLYPPKLTPPLTTFERSADPISHCSLLKRYESEISTSQCVGNLWDRFQTRSFISSKRPINFVSSSSRTQYVPLYTGYTESLNPDDIDNPDGDLKSLGKPRTSKILHTIMNQSENIPGYSGKVHFAATHPTNSNIPPTGPDTSSAIRRIICENKDEPNFRHKGPLSKMVTLVEPYCSFNKMSKKPK